VIADVILPCLNEALALPWILDRMPDGFRPIVVDNGSTDGSGEVVRSLGATVVPEAARGSGQPPTPGCWPPRPTWCASATATAASTRGSFRCWPARWNPARPTWSSARRRPAQPDAWPLPARLANWELARRVRRRPGLGIRDLGPMRAAGREALLGLNLADRRFGYPLEMVMNAAAVGWRVSEVQVAYLPRVGKSKVTGTVGGCVRTVRDMSQVLARW
jgi:glycosyltransferase involved in cell wall biosynthesis